MRCRSRSGFGRAGPGCCPLIRNCSGSYPCGFERTRCRCWSHYKCGPEKLCTLLAQSCGHLLEYKVRIKFDYLFSGYNFPIYKKIKVEKIILRKIIKMCREGRLGTKFWTRADPYLFNKYCPIIYFESRWICDCHGNRSSN